MSKNNEEQWARLGSLNISPRRRPVLYIDENLGGSGAKEDLPERSEGETERNLRIPDRSKVPRLPTQEKNFIDARRGTTVHGRVERNVKRGDVGNFREHEDGLLIRGSGCGRIRRYSGGAPAISKVPPPKAPTAYWQDLKAEEYTETRKGEDPNGIDSEGKEQKGKVAKGKDAKWEDANGEDPNGEETEGKDGKGGILKGGRHY